MSDPATTNSPRPPLKLLAKLLAVMEATGHVQKNGHNDFHNYDYVTEADLLEAVRGHLTGNRILVLPAVVSTSHEGTLTTVMMEYTFYDVDSGESLTQTWAGQGDDKGDKGVYKALTGATKYFLVKSFLISTGDDPERVSDADRRNNQPKGRSNVSVQKSNVTTMPSAPICTPKQFADLWASATAAGLQKSDVLKKAQTLWPDKPATQMPEWLTVRQRDELIRWCDSHTPAEGEGFSG